MGRWALYNDVDPVACAVTRELISRGVICDGEVDERSIKDIQPEDLRGFAQIHLFCGAGLWSLASRMAGWADSRPLWTASCPCQGESIAGKKLGAADPRHLWPDVFRLADACRPPVLVGEQVARAAGTHWLDRVAADLESCDYAFRAVDIPACAVDAPHRRQRLYWCAVDNASGQRLRESREPLCSGRQPIGYADGASPYFDGVTMADADRGGHRGRQEDAQRRSIGRDAAERTDERMEHAESLGRREGRPEHELERGRNAVAIANGSRDLALAERSGCEGRHALGSRANPIDASDSRYRSYWSDAEWLQCADGKARRAKPDIRLLVDGMAGRADLWRLAGNSIVPQLAAEVIAALREELDA
jgi:DNA (cytosine-5)-methyltransferase 1